ncbi:Uncharacterised protein [Mycobacteroides abscessus subsp. bolletii]|nr:Uncharacterised protein [Mycobacteroides abscessus subsp. bolletii]SKT80380.1 Uncharacterised protein [Mycobacteroides abscessus subsp. bolletii]
MESVCVQAQTIRRTCRLVLQRSRPVLVVIMIFIGGEVLRFGAALPVVGACVPAVFGLGFPLDGVRVSASAYRNHLYLFRFHAMLFRYFGDLIRHPSNTIRTWGERTCAELDAIDARDGNAGAGREAVAEGEVLADLHWRTV